MALSQNTEVVSMNLGYSVPRLSAGTDVLYKGALVNTVPASGKIVVAADTATHMFAGYVAEYVSAVDGTTVKVIKNDVAWFAGTSPAQTDIDKPVYATADDTLALTATNVLPCGQIVDVDLTNDLWLVDFSKAVIIDATV